jgi:hypothetical protein
VDGFESPGGAHTNMASRAYHTTYLRAHHHHHVLCWEARSAPAEPRADASDDKISLSRRIPTCTCVTRRHVSGRGLYKPRPAVPHATFPSIKLASTAPRSVRPVNQKLPTNAKGK